MGTTNTASVMTLANSIVGVSILAMPFCFKQCGIILASLILILSGIMTRLSCHYLLKSAIMARRRNFEFLAFHTFGRMGKTAVELSIIFLMIGTCIAFFVVMGDLGPAIVGTLLNFNNSFALRPSFLIGLAVFVVLPLGMLRNVDSLSAICTASFIFYLCFVFKVFVESTDNLFLGSWIEDVDYWRPAGILQCLPIFSMALSCQTQLFEIFDSVSNATLDRMNAICKSAINLCTALYISVGFFGYIAYYKNNITGNVLMSFSPSIWSDIIKIGFVLSVAVSFPLVIFPCRASLHSLLFRKVQVPHYELVAGGGNHIPEAKFKCITLFIVTISLATGLLAPNIEIVLGLLGSTIGVIICILFPPIIFIWISTKATSERFLAQVMVAVGLFIMVMGTYANLYLTEKVTESKLYKENAIVKLNDAVVLPPNIIPVIDNLPVQKSVKLDTKENIKTKLQQADSKKKKRLIDKSKSMEAEINIPNENNNNNKEDVDKNVNINDQRKEPPIPVAPDVVNNVASHPQAPPSKDNTGDQNKPVDKIDTAGDKETGLNEVAPKIETEEKLLKEEKTILQHIREENEEKGIGLDVKNAPVEIKNAPAEIANDQNVQVLNKDETLEKKVEPFQKKDITGDIVAQKKHGQNSKRKSDENEQKSPPVAVDNSISNLIKDSVPLPLLVNYSTNSNNKDIAVEKLVRRDILGKLPEREKRDLEYVTMLDETVHYEDKQKLDFKTLESSIKPVDNILAADQHLDRSTNTNAKTLVSKMDADLVTDPISNKREISKNNNSEKYLNNEKPEGSFVSNIVSKSNDTDESCVKKNDSVIQNIADSLETKDGNGATELKSKRIVDKKPIVLGDQTVSGIKSETNFSNSEVTSSLDAKNIDIVDRNKPTQKETEIIAPSKLSNPNNILNVHLDEAASSMINIPVKPMKRDLKSVEKSKNDKK